MDESAGDTSVSPLEQFAIHTAAMFLGLAVVIGVGYIFFNAIVRRDR